MSRQSYSITTKNGIERLDVEATDEALSQLEALLKAASKLTSLYSELLYVENQARQTASWLDNAIVTAGLGSFKEGK